MSVKPGVSSQWRVPVAGLPGDGRALRIEASAEERDEIAQDLGLLDLMDLRADLTVAPAGHDGVRVDGVLEADVRQACVVTLEPVDGHVSERIERVFMPDPDAAADMPAEPSVAQAEVIVDLEAEDPPEPFDGRVIDLKPVLLEQFALGLDPYPRKPGAVAPTGDPTPGEEETARGAFADLARLKTPGKDDPGRT